MQRAPIKDVPKMDQKRKDLFYAKVRRSTDSDCWNWIGYVAKHGYGIFWVADSTYLTHRVAYVNYYGKIPDGMRVLHRCDNQICVNPLHLFLGAPKDNTDDMIAKGRDKFGGSAKKLDADKVVEIRNLWETTDLSQREIGDKFGVCHQQVYHIIKRLHWKHVP